MPSIPASTLSNAQPALRIPTFDSMKRFSAATDFSDMPDFEFTKTMDEDPLVLPDYLLKEIDTGRQGDAVTPSRYQCNGTTAGEGLTLDFGNDLPRDGRKDAPESKSKLGTRDPLAGPGLMAPPARTSSRVPFNPSRPASQLTTNDGITALPTLASRGLLFDDHDMREKDSAMPPTSRKRKASFALSNPIKRLRNLSLDTFTSKRHKRRRSSLSCVNDVGPTIEDEKSCYSVSTTKLNTPGLSPSSVTPATPTTFSSPTPIARYTNTLATTIIPAYPPSSPLQASQPPSPGQLLLPNDLTCLDALQDIISNLHAENKTLKQQVKMLREDWYATHDELLVERYEGWEKECQLERLRYSDEEERGKRRRGQKNGKMGSDPADFEQAGKLNSAIADGREVEWLPDRIMYK